MKNQSFVLFLNSLLILIISGILLGAFYVQFVEREQPCPLCLLQRVGMIGVAFGAFLNVRFGPHTSHYAFSLLCCAVGGSVALRQIALHVCPTFPAGGPAMFGLSLYVWSFIIFVCSVLYISLLLFLYTPTEFTYRKLNSFSWIASLLLFIITFVNFAATLIHCGLTICPE